MELNCIWNSRFWRIFELSLTGYMYIEPHIRFKLRTKHPLEIQRISAITVLCRHLRRALLVILGVLWGFHQDIWVYSDCTLHTYIDGVHGERKCLGGIYIGTLGYTVQEWRELLKKVC